MVNLAKTLLYFNPHSHEGSDPIPAISAIQQRAFQSTLPRRERLSNQVKTIGKSMDFNPHSHEGSDNQQHTTREYDRDFNPHSHEGSDSNINQ